MNIRDIIKMLRPLRNRMYVNSGLFRLLACLCAGGAAGMLLAYASLWIPVPFLMRSLLYIYGASAAAGIIISAVSVPRTKLLIETADTLGLKERLITAWQLQTEDTVIARLQRRDAVNAVSSADFKRLYPIRFPLKLGAVLGACLALTSVSFFIPAYARETAGQIEKLQSVVEVQLEELEKVSEELKNNGDLKQAELDRILEEVARLTEELKRAGTEEEAMKALSRAENELEKLDMQKQLSKLGEVMSRNEMTGGIGKAVQDGSATDLKQALEQLMQQLEQEEISSRELAEMLEQVAGQMDNQELAEKLEQAAEGLDSADTEEQLAALENLGEALSAMMSSSEGNGTGQAVGQLSQAIQQAGSRISQVDNNLPAGGEDSRGTAGQSPGRSSELQASQSGGQSSGTGQGSNPGQAQGAEQGSGGGAGEGSTNEDSGYTGGERPGGGRKAGEGREEEFEKLYDPEHLGGDTDPSYVSGQKHDGGQSSYSQTDRIPVEKGAILPYHEVLRRYGDQAASYMEETEIPAAMKEIVREYFESLE
jgi:flagellar motility protein MotE (MotC chaperone)